MITEAALSSKQALEKIKERAGLVKDGKGDMFKLILLDYYMPETDGLETAKLIRQYIEQEGLT